MSAARSLTDEDVRAIARAVVEELRAPKPKPTTKPTAPDAEAVEIVDRLARRRQGRRS